MTRQIQYTTYRTDTGELLSMRMDGNMQSLRLQLVPGTDPVSGRPHGQLDFILGWWSPLEYRVDPSTGNLERLAPATVPEGPAA